MNRKIVPVLALTLCFGALAPAVAVTPPTSDAQTSYSAEEVGIARRAFRAKCVRYQPAERCECYTAGFAQALTPPELRLATALLPSRFAGSETVRTWATNAAITNAAKMGFADATTRQEAMTKISEAELELAPICNGA